MFSNSDIIPPLTNQIHTFPEHVLQFITAQKKPREPSEQWLSHLSRLTLQQTLVPPLWILQPRQICINKNNIALKYYISWLFSHHDIMEIFVKYFIWSCARFQYGQILEAAKHVKYFNIVNCTISQYCQSYNIAKLSIVQYCVFQTKCWTINNWHQLHLKQCIYFKTNEAAEYFNSSGSIILIFVLKDISEP